jgi:polyphosphate:AMP phosphotransferase
VFETVELGRKVSKKEFKERTPAMREALLTAQRQLREAAAFPVIVLFAGVDGAGKSETVNLLNEWMDPRWIVARAFGPTSEEERERPEYWRFWRELPPKGRIGLFLSAWYSNPLLQKVHGLSKTREFEDQLKEILDLEKTLADDGALILKFWMHLGKKDQRKRLKALEKDPLQSWRVTKRDWQNWRMYDKFVETAERIISRTSTGEAPWFIVEGLDHHYRSLRVSEVLLNAMQIQPDKENVGATEDTVQLSSSSPAETPSPTLDKNKGARERVTVLSKLEMPKNLTGKTYKGELAKHQGELNLLQRKAREKKVSTILVFEGSDAGGKGGAIRRITAALDARAVQIIPIAAPTDEERAQHYLWRFWRHLPRSGRVTIFDRSWYGRVLVERVEGFAADDEWRRAYTEINAFERQLVGHGIALAKFWLHITKDEQLRRFKLRQETPFKRWKITDEDWRNREKWEEYETAVHDMVERTSTQIAPWTLVEGNDKKFARIKVLQTVCESLKRAME